MKDASEFLKSPALLCKGNIIFNPIPSPDTGFDWFRLPFNESSAPVTKLVGLDDFSPLEDLSGALWVPVTESHRLRETPPVYRLVMPSELYFSDEADAVHFATWIESQRDKIVDISNMFATKNRGTMNLHGVLHVMGLWDEHLF